MYETFFHLKEAPFRLTPDPQFFYLSRQHEEALAHLSFGVRERKGFIILTGEVGTGKTTLSRLFLGRLTAHTRTSLIFNPNLTPVELLQAINQDFGIFHDTDSKKGLIDALNAFLLQETAAGRNAVLLIDEAQNLSVESMEEIRLLSNLETEKEKLLQIVLVGQPELQKKLDLPELRQFNQRVALRYPLHPLSEEEMEGYIQYRLRMAGGPGEILFSPDASRKIHRFSGGYPRTINLVCDKALLAAYVAGTGIINGSLADKAIRWGGAAALVVGLAAVFGLGYFTGSDARPNFLLSPFEFAPFDFAQDRGKEIGESAVGRQSAIGADGFDGDGVFRSERVEETFSAAAITLLHLWRMEVSPSEIQGRGFRSPSALGEGQGLLTYSTPIDLDLLRVLDYPVLFSIRERGEETRRYVVLAGLNGDQATLLDPIRGKVSYSREDFGKLNAGEGTVWWRALKGMRFPLKVDDYDGTVERLQRALRGAGYNPGEVDGLLGEETRTAAASFWKDQGVALEGVGPEIFLVMSKRVLGEKVPSLKKPRRER
ncbi:MAG: AAA family ATPase [Nitrospirae bacterium]|nr:AAA family ATPase [Nitrospirota bacterium]